MRSISKKLVGTEEERAVSPVIGVILMVAITVILAAVIAAFVLDIGPGDTDPSASFTADVNNDGDVDVELQSLGSGTDGIVVVNDTSDDGAFADDPLTVSGASETYDDDDVEDSFGEDTALIAYSSDNDPDEISEVNTFAIIDNLEDLES